MNAMNGYLTPDCVNCPSWHNDEHSIGCGTHQPIGTCPFFAEMEKLNAINVSDSVVNIKNSESVEVLKKSWDKVSALVRYSDGSIAWTRANSLLKYTQT